MMSLALCPQVVSQAPQCLRLSETQTAFDACFAASPSAVAFSWTPECPVQPPKRVDEDGHLTLHHASVGFPFHITVIIWILLFPYYKLGLSKALNLTMGKRTRTK